MAEVSIDVTQPIVMLTWSVLITHALLAMFGGFVKVLAHDDDITVKDILKGMCIGSYTGLVIFAVMTHFQWGRLLVSAATCIAGYTGQPVLDMLSGILQKMIKKHDPSAKNGEQHETSTEVPLEVKTEGQETTSPVPNNEKAKEG